MWRIWTAAALLNCGFILTFFWHGEWLLDPHGKPLTHDFLDLWAAGIRAWEGDASLAYDANTHMAFQGQLIGRRPPDLPFPYPPHFLFFLLPFAPLSYVPGMLAFLATTIAAYVAALRQVTGNLYHASALALAAGGGFTALRWGQAGFLMSAMLVGGLALLPSRPLLAGFLFGCLTVKPHLGLALAFGLILGRQWKAMGAAIATCICLSAAAEIAFGPGIWKAFFDAAALQSEYFKTELMIARGQSVFSLSRAFLEVPGSMTVHLISAVSALALLWWIWRTQGRHEIRAAALVATTLLLPPYLFAYDSIMLTGAAAFLLRKDTHPVEKILIVLACLLPGLTFVLHSAAVPIGAWLMLYVAARTKTDEGTNRGFVRPGSGRIDMASATTAAK